MKCPAIAAIYRSSGMRRSLDRLRALPCLPGEETRPVWIEIAVPHHGSRRVLCRYLLFSVNPFNGRPVQRPMDGVRRGFVVS